MTSIYEKIVQFPFDRNLLSIGEYAIPILARREVRGYVACYWGSNTWPNYTLDLRTDTLIHPSPEWYNDKGPTLGQMAEVALKHLGSGQISSMVASPSYDSLGIVEYDSDKIYFSLTANGIDTHEIILWSDLSKLVHTWQGWFKQDFPNNPVTWYVSGVETTYSDDVTLNYDVRSRDLHRTHHYASVLLTVRAAGHTYEIGDDVWEPISSQQLIQVLQDIGTTACEPGFLEYNIPWSSISIILKDDEYFLTDDSGQCSIGGSISEFVNLCLDLVTHSEIGSIPSGQQPQLAATRQTLADLQRQLATTQQELVEMEQHLDYLESFKGVGGGD